MAPRKRPTFADSPEPLDNFVGKLGGYSIGDKCPYCGKVMEGKSSTFHHLDLKTCANIGQRPSDDK